MCRCVCSCIAAEFIDSRGLQADAELAIFGYAALCGVGPRTKAAGLHTTVSKLLEDLPSGGSEVQATAAALGIDTETATAAIARMKAGSPGP